MSKCDCYRERTDVSYHPYFPYGKTKDIVGYCFGTKEQDDCLCGGDRSKCDFYDYIKNDPHESKTEKKLIWHQYPDERPTEHKRYLVQVDTGVGKEATVSIYNLDKDWWCTMNDVEWWADIELPTE